METMVTRTTNNNTATCMNSGTIGMIKTMVLLRITWITMGMENKRKTRSLEFFSQALTTSNI